MTSSMEKGLTLTPQEFAHLGDGAVAYVKTISSEDVARLFPQAPRSGPASCCSRFSATTARRSC